MVDDISLAKTHYRECVEIEGYILRKPLELVIFEDIDQPEDKLFTAMHTLPSRKLDQMGVELEGTGSTIEEATDNLTKKITDLYEEICIECPSSREKIGQRGYLKSIMVKE